MSEAAVRVSEVPARPRRSRSRHFVPVEDAPPFRLSERTKEILALLWIGVCLFALLALATFALPEIGATQIPRGGGRNLGGSVGHSVAWGLSFVFGRASYLLLVFALLHAVLLFVRREMAHVVQKLLGVLVFTVMVAILLAGEDGLRGYTATSPYGAGGRIGIALSPKLHQLLGGPGRILFLIFGAIVAFMLATDWLFSSVLLRSAERVSAAALRLRSRGEVGPEGHDSDGAVDPEGVTEEDARQAVDEGEKVRKPEKPARAERTRKPRSEELVPEPEKNPGVVASSIAEREPEPQPVPEGGARPQDGVPAPEGLSLEGSPPKDSSREDSESENDADVEPGAPSPASPAARRIKITRPKRPKKSEATQQHLPFNPAYPFPPIDLFREPRHSDDVATRELIEKNAEAIEKKLGSFRIEAKVVGVSPGPAVTQYEVRLAEGIKVSRVVSFEADLAAALMAVSVRVVAPIPGKDTVGVEVPNSERQIVVMRELLEQFGRGEHLSIPLYLGKDVTGKPIIEDLARMPHLLIAGTTGSGKSVCINTILLSILMTRTPEQVRLILIDPKMVELQAYRKVPHLSCEVVTNMKKAPGVLQWAVEEMEKRYALFSSVGVNHISTFNKLGKEEIEKRLQREIPANEARIPYQVLVIDELADLIVVAQNEVEESIQRLAQKSRAVGIHVILATQRPSADVITGVIKANLPCQIAFRVNRKIDSRVILDVSGAEKLLGHGDMLYMPPGSQGLVRAQGTFVSDEEIRRVVEFLQSQGQQPNFLPDLVQSETGSRQRSPAEIDDLYLKAVEVILGQQRGSATLLQRALAVGYTRATRLLELMEEDGLVGGFNGSKSRDVLMTHDEYQQREAAMKEELARLAAESEADSDSEPDEAAGEGDGEGDGEGLDAGNPELPGPEPGQDPEAEQVDTGSESAGSEGRGGLHQEPPRSRD